MILHLGALVGRLSIPVGRASRMELLGATGALLGITLTALLSSLLAHSTFPFIVAPLGASAVLLFAVPASPLAQPWSIVGGNTLSAAVGVAVSLIVSNMTVAAGLAVALAIVVMIMTRSLHPPGGAAALTAVLVHPSATSLSAALLFPFLPVALNSLILVLVGVLFHKISGHRYPHSAEAALASPSQRLAMEDIEAALTTMGDAFDIDPADLQHLLLLAEQHALERTTRTTPDNRA
ncbi:HPP family protein [Acetobacter okinawensis]|uniref:HPP family protein n=1 Tax=Acetobacter okinawensis TaxID=1076594 RepID=UPI001FD4FB78|nr:HPP family protein [Acetobacter okinawensis]